MTVIRPEPQRPHALHACWMFITCYNSFKSHVSSRKLQLLSQLSTSPFCPRALKFHVVWQNLRINPSVIFRQRSIDYLLKVKARRKQLRKKKSCSARAFTADEASLSLFSQTFLKHETCFSMRATAFRTRASHTQMA